MQRKQIIFDLDTNVSKKILGSNYNNLYQQIRKYMQRNNFIHIEGSSYMSNKAMSEFTLYNIIDGLIEEIPCLKKCCRDMRVTNISRVHSLNYFFDYDGTPGKYARSEDDIQSELDDYYDDFEM